MKHSTDFSNPELEPISDLQIQCSDGHLWFNKQTMFIRCDIYKAKCRVNPEKNNVFNLPDYTKQSVNDMLNWINFDEIAPKPSSEHFHLADYLQMDVYKARMGRLIIGTSISIDPVFYVDIFESLTAHEIVEIAESKSPGLCFGIMYELYSRKNECAVDVIIKCESNYSIDRYDDDDDLSDSDSISYPKTTICNNILLRAYTPLSRRYLRENKKIIYDMIKAENARPFLVNSLMRLSFKTNNEKLQNHLMLNPNNLAFTELLTRANKKLTLNNRI